MPNTNDQKLLCRFSSIYRKLLDRVSFIILPNINDRAGKVYGVLLNNSANGGYVDGLPHTW